MANSIFCLLSFLLVAAAFARSTDEGGECQLERLTASKPSKKIASEVGMIEMWDEEEKQMQCVGVAALNITLHPRGLSFPNFDPSPRISYIIKGQAVVGISYPWCPSTFNSGSSGDSYQKTMRFKQGDVVAVPPGVIHWCYNDGEEDLVAITVVDLKSGLNQLDPKFKPQRRKKEASPA